MDEITDRRQFGELLNSLHLTNEAAEIGVHRGEFAHTLLGTWKGKSLFLVDPWSPMSEYANDPTNNGDRNADYRACLKALRPYRYVYMAWRMTSAEAAQRLLDCSLDFIYIDANHNEEYVRRDLALWYPKLVPGGIFAGHDYCSTATWPGVRVAVDDFVVANKITDLCVTGELGGSWWWRKPQASCATLCYPSHSS
jgi:hypothetical protein